MPIKTDSFVFTGTTEGLTCYVSKGKNILRKRTSLDAERVRKDPAFKGFRNSCNRMRKASPIAALLYAMVPAKHREYPLYRVLTGATLKLLKQGMAEDEIKIVLRKEYIEPLMDAFLLARRALIVPCSEGCSPFSYGRLLTGKPVQNSRLIRQRRSIRSVAALPVASVKNNVRYLPAVVRIPRRDPPDTNDLPGLIYLGRPDEASKLRMYQRADMGFVIGLNAEVSVLRFT